MTRTPDIHVSGPVARWAREQRGLTLEVAAKRSGIPEVKLLAIESEEGNPSLAQLRNLAETYRRPLIVMLLDEVPTSFQALTDYRRLPDAKRNSYSPELRDEIKRAIQQRMVYSELLMAMDQQVVEPPLLSILGDAPLLANRIRGILKVTQEELVNLGDKDIALTYWRSKIEDLGILVLETSRVELSEMRGFSLVDKLPLVIVLNGTDSPRGKIFTLLHELSHLCLRSDGVCDLHSKSSVRDDLEIYCNAVAGAALIPELFLMNLPVVRGHSKGQIWRINELEQIRDAAGGASVEAILRRLVDLNLATQKEYEIYRDESRVAYEDFRKRRAQRSKGGPPPFRLQLRDRGRPFVRSVFNAYGEGFLSLSDVTEFVGLRVKHLDKLQREAFK